MTYGSLRYASVCSGIEAVTVMRWLGRRILEVGR